MAIHEFNPDYATPPGDILEEVLESLNITKRSFAEKCSKTPEFISNVIKGSAPISAETADDFENVLNIKAQFWLNLENNYRLFLLKKKKESELQNQLDWLKNFPIPEMKKRNILSAQKDKIKTIKEFLKFFGVASINAYENIWQKKELPLALRNSGTHATNPYSLSVWIKEGEIKASNIFSPDYDKNKFKNTLKNIRENYLSNKIENIEIIRKLFEEAGVLLLFVKPYKGLAIGGMARWLSPKKALIQLSLRHKRDDQFWFSLIHECIHILEHPKKKIYIHNNHTEPTNEEREADLMASNYLIPQKDWQAFISQGIFSISSVIKFAKEIKIPAGIIVGRLQREELIPYSHLNDLKVSIDFKK